MMSSTLTQPASLSLEPKVLADALAAVKPCVGTRSAVQALSGVRVKADWLGAYLYATDTDVSVRKRITGLHVGPELDALVSHAELAKAAKLFAKRTEVRLELPAVDPEEKVMRRELVVTDGRRTIKLPFLRMEDHPPEPNWVAGELLLQAQGKELASVITRSATFASKDETRPILTGMYLDLTGTNETGLAAGAEMVTTDSYRLSVIPVDGTCGDSKLSCNIPARALKLAAKSMGKGGTVTLYHAHPLVRISIPEAGEDYTVRQLEGQFPNYRQLIPDAWEHDVTMPRTSLAEACEVAVAFCTNNAPARLSLNGSVSLHGYVPDGAGFEEHVDGAEWHRTRGSDPTPVDSLEIGFNPEFLRDIVKACEGETVLLSLISPLRPGLVTDHASGAKYLLMPIRLNV